MVPGGVKVGPRLQQVPDVLQHVQLRQGPGLLDAVLGDASAGHGCLQAVQRLLVLTQVVGHVAIRVDCQEVSTTSNEQLHQAQVATGGRGVQRCPALAVAGIDPGPSFQELLHHLPEVVDAALWSRQPECPSPHHGPSLPSHRQRG